MLAQETAVLDDIGEKLKTARSLGMISYKVESVEGALGFLQEVTGFSTKQLA